MFPNININDRVLVLKDKLFDIEYSVGDVIVFYSLESSSPNNSELLIENLKLWELINNEGNKNQTVYIKRIVGTPGDEISINIKPEKNCETYEKGYFSAALSKTYISIEDTI